MVEITDFDILRAIGQEVLDKCYADELENVCGAVGDKWATLAFDQYGRFSIFMLWPKADNCIINFFNLCKPTVIQDIKEWVEKWKEK